MKVITNNYNNSINTTIEINPYPREITCEYCQSELEYEESDVRVGKNGWAFIDCPLCGKEVFLDDNEKELKLTKDNIKFPTHFWHTSTETGAVDCCDTVNIRRYLSEAILYFRQNKNEYCWGTHITGNLYLNVLRYDGDEEYVVTVSNDFYTVNIPFEEEDY